MKINGYKRRIKRVRSTRMCVNLRYDRIWSSIYIKKIKIWNMKSEYIIR